MPTAVSFLCRCGVRIVIATEGHDGRTAVPCPTSSCKVRHMVSGKVIQAVVFDNNGKSVPYDWRAIFDTTSQ